MKSVFCISCGYNIDFLGSSSNWCEGCKDAHCDECFKHHKDNCELITG